MATQPPGTPDNDANREMKVSGDAPAPPAALLGEKYRVERVIGEGAFGRVYLATDTRLRRAVAIKELLATRNATDPEIFRRYLDRFEREARAGGAITNPHVVTVYELAIDRDQNTYLVMEYVDGTNLGTLLSQVGNLPIERVVAIALDIARGLEVVHEADVVHRDLKPANIMISRRGGAKVGDFGIAQVGTESQRTQVVIGHPGTPLYMSPEQASGFGYIDGRSDLYSLGLVIYEMLVGEPYARRRVPLAQARQETPPALIAIVEKLIQRDPDQRFQSANDLITELSKLSIAPQRAAAAADVYAIPAPPSGSYPPGPPSQPGSYPGNVAGVPSVYGGAPSQPAGAPTGSGYSGQPSGAPSPYGPPSQPPIGAYGPPTGGPPAQPPYGTQQFGYAQQPPPLPPRKRGGFPPLAIVGIIAAVLIVAIGGLALIGSRGGTSATATVPTNTQVAIAATRSAPTANAAATTNATATATVRTGTTPTTGASTALATIARGSATPVGAIGTARATGAAATPYPTASNQVKLAAGKPLPTAAGPNIYVGDGDRYTLHFPTDWSLSPGDANTEVQFTFQGTQIAGVTTSDLDGEKKPTAQELADQILTTFAKQLTNFKMTEATQIKVAGQDGVRMLYTFTDAGNTVTLGGYLLTFSTDQTVILFSGYASKDSFDARVPTFDNVAGSFTNGVALDNNYTDPQGRFTFNYPANWAEKKPNSTSVAALVAPTAGTPSFNVVTESSGPRTVQQYYDANIRTIADPSTGLKAYKKVSESDTMITGLPAKLQVYTADLGGNGTIYELYQWFIVKDGKGYVLTYSALADKAKDFAGFGPIIANSFMLV